MSSYNNQWSSFFGNLSQQADTYSSPVSPSNQYYAYVSKVDEIDGTSNVDIFLEMMTKEWGDIVLFNPPISVTKLPSVTIPVVCYSMLDQPLDVALSTFGLKTADDLAEGSWYLIQLQQGATGKLTGVLFDPDFTDFQ